VAATFSVGDSYNVLIKSHDSFFVYQNISQALVKKDDAVSSRMKIGTLVAAQDELVYRLGLQIWTEAKGKSTKIEPEDIIGFLAKSDK
jgi:hypothetical protein